MSTEVPALSIIVPSYNEEARLPATLERIAAYVSSSGRSSEVLVVDDGSKDGTSAIAESFRGKIPALRVLSNEEADKLLTAISNNNDVAIGSRALDRNLISTHQSPFREFAGIVFNTVVRTCLQLPFVDTQCGFKAFRRERCQIIFEQQKIERFGFDPELLYLAQRHGLRAVEIPVRWGHSPATKVSMFRDSIQMFLDVFTIRWNSIRGRYPRKQK